MAPMIANNRVNDPGLCGHSWLKDSCLWPKRLDDCRPNV